MTLRVDGREIHNSIVEYELQRLLEFYSRHMPTEQLEGQMPEIREKAKNQAIGAFLLNREARRLNLSVSDEEVDTTLNALVAKIGGAEAFDDLLRREGMTMPEFRESMENGKRLDSLVKQITGSVEEPTEKDIAAHFEKNQANYAVAERVRSRHILVQPASDGIEDRQAAVDQLLQIKQQIDDGADFGEMASSYSNCSSGRASGGSLGWVTRGAAIPQLDEALFALKPGEVSGVVETSMGFHIVMATDREPARPAQLDEVRGPIHDLLLHNRRGKAISEHVEKLKAGVQIVED
jgi:parvulin-like peptidyl-prolyl isomerase